MCSHDRDPKFPRDFGAVLTSEKIKTAARASRRRTRTRAWTAAPTQSAANASIGLLVVGRRDMLGGLIHGW
jgi:hypothetical protein